MGSIPARAAIRLGMTPIRYMRVGVFQLGGNNMVKFIGIALQLVIILILLKICFDLTIVAVTGM